MASHLRVKKTKSPGVLKHVPERTCVACREVGPKQALIRLVLTPEGAVEVDSTRRRTGRGVYLCPRTSCWEKGLREKTLGQAFRTRISPQSLEGLRKYMAKGNNLEEGEK